MKQRPEVNSQSRQTGGVDLFEGLVPDAAGGVAVQVAYLVVGTLLWAAGTAIYVGVGAGAGPRDSVNLAIARVLGVGVGVAWMIAQVAVLLIGLVLGGTIGPASIIFAVLIGPMVELAFWLLGVERRGDFWAARVPGTAAAA